MYNKLFTKILDSSIWLESNPTRIVWITLMAAMDEDGFCAFASPANLAHRAVVSFAECLDALAILEAPDPNSADPDNEGRRIERLPGGWYVLNAPKYREIVSREESKRLNRERQRLHYGRRKTDKPENLTDPNANLTLPNAVAVSPNAHLTQSEAEANTEAQIKNVSTAPQSVALPLEIIAPGVLFFPTVGTGEKTWALSAAQIADWQDVYPAVDVFGECAKANAWIKANTSRRKTPKGMARFLVNWLNKAVDVRSAGGSGRGHDKGSANAIEADAALDAVRRAEARREGRNDATIRRPEMALYGPTGDGES